MIDANIIQAIATHLDGLTLTPALPIAWPDRDFKPPSIGGYLRLTVLPNRTEAVTIGRHGVDRHRGIAQVDVCWRQGKGSVDPFAVRDAIATHFKRGTWFDYGDTTVRIVEPPSPGPSLKDSAYTIYPLSVRYFADASNAST